MADLVPLRRALISVSDKAGLAEFAAALQREFGVELVSTGGTAKFLRDAGLEVTDVADVTGFPEMMDGRVKTLHPKIHGGLLALRDNAEHVDAMKRHGIQPIDLVCINLYPFAQAIAKPGVSYEEAIENIDIGGPSMIRSAAKNHAFVLVVTSPERYERVLGDLRKHQGSSCLEHRRKQAQRAFAHTAEYDAKIAEYLASKLHGEAITMPAGTVVEWSVSSLEMQLLGIMMLAPASVPLAGPEDFKEARHKVIFESLAALHEQGRRSIDAVVLREELQRKGKLSDAGGTGYLGQLLGAAPGPSTVESASAILGMIRALHPASPGEAAGGEMPAYVALNLTKKQSLRYGENPHQKAALYVDRKPTEASVAYATQHHGKELSYINLLDADAALSAVKELSTPAACIVKHATPCGFATAADLPTAFRNAFAGDPLAAFGGIVALNGNVDKATAEAITSIDKLLEVVVAPSYSPDALDLLKTRWKNVRLLEVGPTGVPDRGEHHLHKIVGGYLIQERDLLGADTADWKVVSKRPPTAREMDDLKVAWLACKHVKSNAIVLARGGMMVGSGAGQQDRVNACRIAIAKAGDRATGSVAASDAFFPFPDGPQLLLDAGVTAIVQPGGSLKDAETVAVVDAAGAAMVLTGRRHFKH